MATWPLNNPQKGFKETLGYNIIRSSMDAGPAKQRKRSNKPSTLSISYLLSATELNNLITFIDEQLGGVRRFDITHPRTNATVSARIVPKGQGDLLDIVYAAPDYYTVGVELEILPPGLVL